MTQHRRGFTLLELAVVLALLSLLIGFGVNVGQNAVKSTSRLAMLEKMALIKQSLDDYGARNGYLPCPADPQLLPSAARYGIESRNAAAGAGCVDTGPAGVRRFGNVWYGMLPVANLGLDDSYSVDAWGNKLTYAVSMDHVGVLDTPANGLGFNSYTYRQGLIIINSNTAAAPVTLTTTIAGSPGAGATYAVVSHGKNGRGAYPMNATVAGSCTTGFIDSQNCDRADAIFYDSDYNEGAQATTQFDDYIVWGTNKAAQRPTNLLPNSCPGACEAWCAPCEIGGRSSAPGTATRLCAKFITRNCEARCIWPTDTMPCP